ncbi:glycosyl hydrolase family 25 [Cooperia oncophora]
MQSLSAPATVLSKDQDSEANSNRVFITLAAVFGVSLALTGFDSIEKVPRAKFKCMKSVGYSFFVGRVYQSNSGVDHRGIKNIKDAQAVRFKRVDGYISPCLTSSCPSAAKQASRVSTALKKAGVKVQTIWIDVEKNKWSSNKKKNRAFISKMGKTLTDLGHTWGIYTNKPMWKATVGSHYTALKNKPLWWARYDNTLSFKNFKSFGGWKKPNIHQYSGYSLGPCSFKIEENWYPKGP